MYFQQIKWKLTLLLKRETRGVLEILTQKINQQLFTFIIAENLEMPQNI